MEDRDQEKTVVETQGHSKKKDQVRRYSLKGRDRGTYTKEDKYTRKM